MNAELVGRTLAGLSSQLSLNLSAASFLGARSDCYMMSHLLDMSVRSKRKKERERDAQLERQVANVGWLARGGSSLSLARNGGRGLVRQISHE